MLHDAILFLHAVIPCSAFSARLVDDANRRLPCWTQEACTFFAMYFNADFRASLKSRLPAFLDACTDRGLCSLLDTELDRLALVSVLAIAVGLAACGLFIHEQIHSGMVRVSVLGLLAGFCFGVWTGVISYAIQPSAAYLMGPFRLGPRVVISSLETSSAPQRWVVLSSTHHASRLFTTAIVAFHWATFLQYKPYVVLVGPLHTFDAQRLDALHHLTVALGGRFSVINFNSTSTKGVCMRTKRCLPWSSLAQTLRIFAAALPGIDDRDEIITADDDRLPLFRLPFHVAPRPGSSVLRISHYSPGYRNEGKCSSNITCTQGYHFDMCYVRGTRLAWKEAFYGLGLPDWGLMLQLMYKYHFGIAKTGRDRWFGDQALLTRHLIAWNDGRPDGRKLDTIYMRRGDVAPSPGWWSATHIYDPAHKQVRPSALKSIRSKQAFELHKLQFDANEFPFSKTNQACTLKILRAALDSLGASQNVIESKEWPPAPLAIFFSKFLETVNATTGYTSSSR